MQFGGGYHYPSGLIFTVFSILAVIITALVWHWASLAAAEGFILLLSLEGTILLASAFSPVGLHPPPKGLINRARWFLTQQAGVPVSYNSLMFYSGLLCLCVVFILTALVTTSRELAESNVQTVMAVIQVITTMILAFGLWLAFRQLAMTRENLKSQRRHFEIEMSPWLTGSDLKPQRVESNPMKMEMDEYLVLKNVGKTPAVDVKIYTNWEIIGQGSSNGRKEYSDITIAPKDEQHILLCRLPYKAPADLAKGKINTVITYRTPMGGRGQIGLSFTEGKEGWSNGPSTYKFTASDATEYGEPQDFLADFNYKD